MSLPAETWRVDKIILSLSAPAFSIGRPQFLRSAISSSSNIHDDRYMLIDFSKNVEARYIASHFAYGGKPAYSLSLRRYVLAPTDYRRIAEEIIQISQDR